MRWFKNLATRSKLLLSFGLLLALAAPVLARDPIVPLLEYAGLRATWILLGRLGFNWKYKHP